MRVCVIPNQILKIFCQFFIQGKPLSFYMFIIKKEFTFELLPNLSFCVVCSFMASLSNAMDSAREGSGILFVGFRVENASPSMATCSFFDSSSSSSSKFFFHSNVKVTHLTNYHKTYLFMDCQICINWLLRVSRIVRTLSIWYLNFPYSNSKLSCFTALCKYACIHSRC